MRVFSRGGPLAYGVLLTVVAALAIAGAASADHWSDYSGTADRHELQQGDPDLCAGGDGGLSFRIEDLTDAGGSYPADNPVVRLFDVDVEGGTLSWELTSYGNDRYHVAAVVMKGGPNAMVYFYDTAAGGLDDSDEGITTPIDEDGEAEDRPYEIDHVDFCFDPKASGGPKALIVNKSAATSWEKIYTWEVKKSVDKPTLALSQGGSGTVQWKVDVTQTGFVARNAVVSGQITVANPNDAGVTDVTLTDALPGAAVDCDGVPGAPYLNTGLTLEGQGFLVCAYTASLGSATGGTNEATAQATLDGVDVSDTGTADFSFGEPSVEINKTVKAVDGKNTWSEITGTTSFTYDETFPCGSRGRTNVVDLLGDNPATPQVETDFELDTDTASVTVTCNETPPPPPPPPPPGGDESMDVQVIKDATPQVQLVNGQADIAYTIRVRNNGPNQAHNVKLADAAPGGVTFLAVTQQPVAGSCSVSGGNLLQCSFGTLGPGVERTIGLSARVTQTGTYVNSATGTGEGKDTNGRNNTDDASTLVTAPVTPPVTPKPPTKPKPKPPVIEVGRSPVAVCVKLKVTPGLMRANGMRQFVIAKVTRSRTPVKGVAVRFSGNGLATIARTNAQGVARVAVIPRNAGITLVRISSPKACNTARIGVVGAFEPPVTG